MAIGSAFAQAELTDANVVGHVIDKKLANTCLMLLYASLAQPMAL